MARFVGRRLLQAIPLLFFISIVSFALIKLAPGDPILTFVTPNMSAEDVERMRQSLGLDRPAYVQYFSWLREMVTGNFGYSLINHRPVLDQVVGRLPATVGLMGAALALSLLFSIPLGMIAAANKNRWIDKLLNMFSYIGISVPSFWFAMLLIYVFAIKLHWLPSMGMRTIGVSSAWDVIKHGILPCTVLALMNVSVYMRYVRSSAIGQLQEDYVQIQYAYGAGRMEVLFKHVMKNVLLPIITLLGMSLPELIGGAIITETVFSWPGMGTLLMNAVFSFDYPIIMAVTVFSALLLIVGNLLADVLYGVVDPRIRASK
ncbi:ABC transporter permease [Paenibacillus thermotolerans]|uniref:ABC transporter permease n=1 Tax=Paenibacillus thermotolerans TaxID=3027807 RepID=UPI0023680949|nr:MULTISPECIES: ABC transporter permease [unclassified Paenibacillus]